MAASTTPAPVANLRTARKAQAAAKRRHPAGSATKKAPAKAAPKPAAKATKAPRKQPAQSGKTKLRWIANDAGEQHATAGDVTYSIIPSGDKFKATMRTGGKTTVLVDGVSGTKAYYAATHHHHYGTMPEAKTAKDAAK
ncbi:MAG: hypothetical protein ACRDTS_16630 [Mycobacterium sp.]